MILSLGRYTKELRSDEVGSKAYNLMYMLSQGINVPAGIVLTTDISQEISLEELVTLISEDIQTLKSTFVMVRSSGVGEDGDDFSFAGQLELDSFQVINDKFEIAKNIKKCWSSLSNKRVEAYSNYQADHIQKMGVIVQEMIEAEFSGVLFTSAPQRREKKIVEYVSGHCEKLVSGKVTPEALYLPSLDGDLPVFVKELDHISSKILDLYKVHQDIEWAYKDGSVFIVQSRPITSFGESISWSSTNVNENYPDKLSPLLYSIARRSYYHYFKNLYRDFSVPISSEGERDLYNIIGLWGERMYYNMSSINKLILLTPFKGLFSKSFNDFVGYQKKIPSSAKKNELISHTFSKIIFVLSTIYHGLILKHSVRKIENLVSDYVSSDASKSDKILYHEFLDLRFNQWRKASVADFFAMLSHGSLGAFLRWIDTDKAAGLQNSLIQSIPDLVSNKPIFDLWELKKYIIEKGELDLFKIFSSTEIYQIIQHDKGHNVFLKMFKNYLNTWGFRCSGELTFLSEKYCEKPETFIDMFKVYLQTQNVDPGIQFLKKHKEQQEVLKELTVDMNQSFFFLKAIPMTIILRGLVSFTMFSISCRERVRLKQAHMYSKFKEVCLSIGRKLVKEEVFQKESDIFFLEYDEISRILNEEFIDKEYFNSLVELRNKKFEHDRIFPENFHCDNIKFLNNVYDQDEVVKLSDSSFMGLPACGGQIKARAVVLESIHEIHKLKKGDILVTKQTDPGWICVFPLISGLVVERGGMLSHGAIVAREFGIPAVVGVKDITKVVKTSDIIAIDGNKGTVECLPL